jgi:hypothetical protein
MMQTERQRLKTLDQRLGRIETDIHHLKAHPRVRFRKCSK